MGAVKNMAWDQATEFLSKVEDDLTNGKITKLKQTCLKTCGVNLRLYTPLQLSADLQPRDKLLCRRV